MHLQFFLLSDASYQTVMRHTTSIGATELLLCGSSFWPTWVFAGTLSISCMSSTMISTRSSIVPISASIPRRRTPPLCYTPLMVSVWQLIWQSMMLLLLVWHAFMESIVGWMTLLSDTSRLPPVRVREDTTLVYIPLPRPSHLLHRFWSSCWWSGSCYVSSSLRVVRHSCTPLRSSEALASFHHIWAPSPIGDLPYQDCDAPWCWLACGWRLHSRTWSPSAIWALDSASECSQTAGSFCGGFFIPPPPVVRIPWILLRLLAALVYVAVVLSHACMPPTIWLILVVWSRGIFCCIGLTMPLMGCNPYLLHYELLLLSLYQIYVWVRMQDLVIAMYNLYAFIPIIDSMSSSMLWFTWTKNPFTKEKWLESCTLDKWGSTMNTCVHAHGNSVSL